MFKTSKIKSSLEQDRVSSRVVFQSQRLVQYESDALMLREEGTVVAGLLMRLNTINYSVMMKGEDLNKSVSMQSFTDSVQQFTEYCYVRRGRRGEK